MPAQLHIRILLLEADMPERVGWWAIGGRDVQPTGMCTATAANLPGFWARLRAPSLHVCQAICANPFGKCSSAEVENFG